MGLGQFQALKPTPSTDRLRGVYRILHGLVAEYPSPKKVNLLIYSRVIL